MAVPSNIYADNLAIWEASRAVPNEAKKAIPAGRLKGMTDINPMWRIKKLTELFGPAGIGWYYEIERTWLDQGEDQAVTCNVLIKLYTVDQTTGKVSFPIQGLGGAMFVSKEKNGYYTDDEAYKKALTDAISVACKALGIGADVYWDKDPTKYQQRAPQPIICEDCGTPITEITGKSGKPISADALAKISKKDYGVQLCAACMEKRKAVKENENNA